MFHVPERFRIPRGPLASTAADGNNGAFAIPYQSYAFRVIASDGMGWEHVSISMTVKRCPNWTEMCFIKDLFWDAEDCVVQFHPPKSEYVNLHDFCLHLWRPTSAELPRPTKILTGF